MSYVFFFFLSSRRRHTRCALVTGVQTCALPICFLPGAREIRAAHDHHAARLANDVAIRPLYGELSSEEQDLALQPDADGRRKLILATNIAQTGLTVEGGNTVVDGGLVRVPRFDLSPGAHRRQTKAVPRESGRAAGRGRWWV